MEEVRRPRTVANLSKEQMMNSIKNDNFMLKFMPKTLDKLTNAMLFYNQTLFNTESDIEDLEKKMEEIHAFLTFSGAKMIADPFIPDYLGFEFDSTQAGINVYSKEGWFISQKGDKWGIIGPEGNHYFVALENMYFGYAFLKAVGCPVSVDDYLYDKTTHIDLEKIKEEAKMIEQNYTERV
jgi:hypothetical protein